MKNLIALYVTMCAIGCGVGSGDVKQIPRSNTGYHGSVDSFSCPEGYQLCDHVCKPQGDICWYNDAAIYDISDSGQHLPLH